MNSINSRTNSLMMPNNHNKSDAPTMTLTDRNEQVNLQMETGYNPMASPWTGYINNLYSSIRKTNKLSDAAAGGYNSPQSVLDEMEMIQRKYHTGVFILDDDHFMPSGRLHSQWISKFIEGLYQRKMNDCILWKISYAIDRTEQSLENIIEDIEFFQEIGKLGEVIVYFTRSSSEAELSASEAFVNQNRKLAADILPGSFCTDNRIKWLQQFHMLAFQRSNGERTILTDDLEFARFDSLLLEKFYPHRYDTQIYKKGILRLIRAANQQSIETMSKMTHFMSSRSEKQIIEDWNFVQYLAQKEKHAQRLISMEVEKLIKQFS